MAQDDISFTDLIASSIHDMKNSLNVQISELEKISDQCKKVGDLQAYEGSRASRGNLLPRGFTKVDRVEPGA